MISFLTHPIQLNDTNNSIPEDPTNKPTPNIPFEQENYKQSQYNKVSAIKKKHISQWEKFKFPISSALYCDPIPVENCSSYNWISEEPTTCLSISHAGDSSWNRERKMNVDREDKK